MRDDLLIKFLLKESTNEENIEVQEWLAADSANRKYFNDFELIWQRSKNLANQSQINENEAWERFKLRVSEKQPEKATQIKPLWKYRSWMNIAAAFILLTGAWFVYTRILAPSATLAAGNGVLIETLPDGSEITLNKQARLSYSFPITSKKRVVKLEQGEAFFKVSRNKEKPFIIETGGVTVEVVGTSFNVNHSKNTTEIIVESGIVKVTEGKETVTLRRGERVTAANGAPLKATKIDDELHNYYRSNQITANNTPLYRVVEVLNKAYNANIIVADPVLKTRTLSTTLEIGSLDQNIQVIAETLNLRVERKGSAILLR